MLSSAAANPPMTRLARQSDVYLAIGVITILGVMVVPLPTPLLDVLLAFNISFSLIVLLVSMYITQPLQFSIFPSLLLVATLFRLSLNVASTRLILGEGYAGRVITAFGTFVVKGNYVVGIIIFLILVVIQFVVITKGAGRVAEVAARFTLDAMPGKQMAIDADLNAGLIDEQEARRRREEIAREADFYGAMDGASKFVRGDAVAGLIITAVNILGGFVVGVVQRGLSLSEALRTYTILTVGDGLVSQIPALIVSTAAGIVVTRAASESHLGEDLVRQVFSHPRPLAIAAAVLVVFAITPGLPALPFFLLAVLVGLAASSARRNQEKLQAAEAQARAKGEAQKKRAAEEGVERYLHVDPMELEIGYRLIPIVDPEHGGDLLHRISMIRKQCALELGIVVPPIRIRDNIQLPPNRYVIRIRGVQVAEGELVPGHCLALESGAVSTRVEGIPTVDPAFGLPAVWIPEIRKEQAERAGYTVVEAPAVLATHLKEVIRQNAHRLLTRQEVSRLVENVKKENQALVDELIPATLTLGQVQKVLQNLLRERVSIRNLVTILEALADAAPMTKDVDILTEYVRNALAAEIYRPYVAEDGKLYAITLDPAVEKMITDGVRHAERVTAPDLPQAVLRQLYDGLQRLVDRMTKEGHVPLVLCSPVVRPYLRKLLEPLFPSLAVLSYTELPPQLEVRTVSILRLSHDHQAVHS